MTPETAESPEATTTPPGAAPLVDGTLKRIALSWIRTDHDTQVRGAVSSARVRDLTAIVNETEGDLDPIDVFLEPGSGNPSAANPMYLADGFHRVEVYRGLEKPKIPARIHIGTKSEAIEFGLRKNGRHGTPMTSKEKRHAAEMAVLDARIGEYTDSKIAKLIGVSPSLVNNARRGVNPPAPVTEINGQDEPQPAKRSRKTAASGKRESESPAPRSATARERKDTEALNRPTKAAILKRIETELNTDCIDDDDLLRLIKSPTGRYVFLPNDGEGITLRVVGISGREQISVPVQIKDLTFDQITLRYIAGKLATE